MTQMQIDRIAPAVRRRDLGDGASGISGVSIDEVSRASGVSKTTIYRHWPSRSALLIDACSRLGGAYPPPDTGTLRADFRALLSNFRLRRGPRSTRP